MFEVTRNLRLSPIDFYQREALFGPLFFLGLGSLDVVRALSFPSVFSLIFCLNSYFLSTTFGFFLFPVPILFL